LATNARLNDEARKKLEAPLGDETEEQKKSAELVLKAMKTGYLDRERD